LSLAFAAAQAGGTAPTVLNAANEIAVAAFLNEGMPYLDISAVVEKTLNAIPVSGADSIECILDIDMQARTVARDCIKSISL
jgi:1-deoxy-D-xylulose-5-phosphate reductoisomerase